MEGLLAFTDKGIYCPPADVYLDPWKPVKKALISHAHADHGRPGHGNYLCTRTTAPILKYRLGRHIDVRSLDYGETLRINGVEFSFHPAGHIIGSAQIRVEYQGDIWVFSGDYKVEDDRLCEAFAPVKCRVFITESTFALPVYRWKPQEEVFREINSWWSANIAQGLTSILCGYALGKAQRLMAGLDPSLGPIFTHGAVQNLNDVIRFGKIPHSKKVTDGFDKKRDRGAIVIAPPGALRSGWLKRFGPVSTATASGWMQLRGMRRRSGVDRGFVLSDHADWTGLNLAISETGAEKVYITHGYTEIFARYLQSKGMAAQIATTEFSETEGDLNGEE
jgi:putative mRNA 3-end processing factor